MKFYFQIYIAVDELKKPAEKYCLCWCYSCSCCCC